VELEVAVVASTTVRAVPQPRATRASPLHVIAGVDAFPAHQPAIANRRVTMNHHAARTNM
jgi:hypothetical protein